MLPGHAAEDDAVEQRVSSEAVVAVHTASNFTRGVKTLDSLPLRVHHVRVRVDLEAAHTIMDHRRNDRDVELVVHGQRQIVEKLLAPLVPPACSPRSSSRRSRTW